MYIVSQEKEWFITPSIRFSIESGETSAPHTTTVQNDMEALFELLQEFIFYIFFDK